MAVAHTPPMPFQWQGSKARIAHWIADRLPPHRRYVEPFAGTAAVLFAKAPSPIEVLNDANEDIVSVFRCLQDPAMARRLHRRLRYTPLSRAEWLKAREREPGLDPVERAARFLIRQMQGFSGKPDGSTWGGGLGDGDKLGWSRVLRRWGFFRRRLRHVALECGDWRDVWDRYDAPDTLIYADPPYLTADLDEDMYDGLLFRPTDHEALVARALASRAMVLISGYRHPIYEALERAGWVREERRVPLGVTGRTQATRGAGGRLAPDHYRVECLWWSPSARAASRRTLTLWDAGLAMPGAETEGAAEVISR